MRHGSTQHCQPKFCSQSSSSVYATPHTIAVLLTQLTRGSCQCNVVPSLCSGRLWTVTYDFFLPSCQPRQMTREIVYCTTLKPSYFGLKISILGYEEMKLSGLKSLWLLADGQPGAAWLVDPGQGSAPSAGN